MRKPLVLLAACAALVAASAVHATTVVPVDLQQLATRASAIVHGRVVTTQSQWSGNGHRVETIVTLEASSYLKGDFGPRVVFRVPGGQLGSIRTVVVGAPAFREGEEVVVFLGATGPAIPYIVGFNQGVFRVSTDAGSGRQTVVRPVMAGEKVVKDPLHSGDVTVTTVPVSEFEGQVRSLVARAAIRPVGNPAGRVIPRIR
jgi:hypothetical protein